MLTVVAAAVLAVQAPTIEMSITTDGKEVGKAWLTQKLEGGMKKTYAKLILGDVRIVETAEYAMDGTPKSKVMTHNDKRIEAVFSASGVSVTGVANPIPLPKSEIKAKSEFWFIQTKPPVNHKVEYQRFDLVQGKFVPCTVLHVGKQEIEFKGKTISANVVRIDNKTNAWLDDRGDPYRMIVDGKTRFERISP
ncbi:MAG: hypothetical protein ABIV13_05230 [Fimbriimonadales bacterium]